MSEPTAHSQVETSTPKELVREPLVLNNRPLGWITNQVAGIVEGDMPKWWNIAFGVSFLLMLMSFGYIGYLITTGVGVWGLNHPVAWGWAIVNFVFWIGIGHAGTLISAILFLLRQKWRTSVNRTAEAMTIFAVICAGIFPGIHVGRIWLAWWLFPATKRQCNLAAVPLAAPLGCVCGVYLFHSLTIVLVYGPNSGSGDHTRSTA